MMRGETHGVCSTKAEVIRHNKTRKVVVLPEGEDSSAPDRTVVKSNPTSEGGSDSPESFARSYQLEALEKAKKQNTIVFLDTGSGKTLIAVMLLRAYAHLIRKPSKSIAVFLVPTVVLVSQQADVVEMHTDLKVGRFWGDMGVDFWDISIWKEKLGEFEVFVTTPQILLNNLRHSFFKLEDINLLIFDECHHARGRHPYACIMSEFYHKCLDSGLVCLPRIFGMTASLINTKGSGSRDVYEKQIRDLENLMNSKVYTVVSESVLAEYVSFSTPKIKLYEHVDTPRRLLEGLSSHLEIIKLKHMNEVKQLQRAAESGLKKLSRMHATLLVCLTELGVWLAMKAAEAFLCKENDLFFWGERNDELEEILRNFSKDAIIAFRHYLPDGHCIGKNFQADINAGFLTNKVKCLVSSLLEYRTLKNLRCIIFVQRAITAIVLGSILSVLPQLRIWEARHMTGNHSGIQCQSRKEHLTIVNLFKDGKVNIIVATQILEEGLDVQSCNLVIRFDPSPTVCSFIQSRGRARMEGSDYLLILEKSDSSNISKAITYLSSGDVMRQESLRLSVLPCAPPVYQMSDESFYRVESTGAIVTLSSSVSLIHFFCSRLPSDGFFKSFPRFVIEKGSNFCTLHLPKSCSMPPFSVEGDKSMLKQLVCLKACKKLHECGALTDNLLPVLEDLDTEAEADMKFVSGDYPCAEKHNSYFPSELVDSWELFSLRGLFHCYRIIFTQNFNYYLLPSDIFFVVKSNLGHEFSNISFNLDTNHGSLNVKFEYMHTMHLSPEQVLSAKKFQDILLNIVIYRLFDKLKCALGDYCGDNLNLSIAYLLLPSFRVNNLSSVNWASIASVLFSQEKISNQYISNDTDVHNCSQVNCHWMQFKNGKFRSCMIKNCVVYTPHNNYIYCITGICGELNGKSILNISIGNCVTYEDFYESRYGITLFHPEETLLSGRRPFSAQNYLLRRIHREKDSKTVRVELPPELCIVLLSHVSASTLYSFSFLPSVMYRIESLLLLSNINSLSELSVPNIILPPFKLLEALTAKRCQECFSLESLETLGDSYLKYAASLHLFKRDSHHHEGILSARKSRLVSNMTLYKLGYKQKLPGFIHNEEFDPKKWVTICTSHIFQQEDAIFFSGSKHAYTMTTMLMKTKLIADVVEALIGAHLCTGGERAALCFMKSLGMDINIESEMSVDRPLMLKADTYVNIRALETLLNYTFQDSSLLVEALTHGSYQVPEIPRCYQRLEFLGDAILDYLITVHMYEKYPDLSPGMLTDLRSASVNNDCYAHAAVKAHLNKHILHASSELHKQMTIYFNNFSNNFSGSSYGWDAGVALPKVLGDVIESLAGAILVDSGYNKERVWQSINPLLEPLVSPETLKYHPVRELGELCAKRGYRMKIYPTCTEGIASVTVEVEIDDLTTINETCTGENRKTAKKLAASTVLKTLKAFIDSHQPNICSS